MTGHDLAVTELRAKLAAMSAVEAAAAYEQLLAEVDAAGRKGKGVYYTPPELVAHVLDLSLQPALERHLAAGGELEDFKVLDLAVGSARFLLPAAERIATAYGVDLATAANAVYGVDVDPLAVEISRRLLGPRARLLVADGLLDDVAAAFPEVFGRANPGFDVVLGNPPFLNRVELATKGATQRTRALRHRYADVWANYVNAATLFLVESTRLARAGAHIALVQPESLLGTRDSAAAREWLEREAALAALWVGKDRVFGAAVRTVVPVLVKGERAVDSVARTVGLPPRPLTVARRATAAAWGALAADAYGVPELPPLAVSGSLGEVAEVSAGFLQEYYLLEPHVREGGAGLRVVTSGMVGGFSIAWGQRTTRLHKRKWLRPTVELAALGDAAERRWTFRTATTPKLLIATQTKVLQVGIDGAGECLGSVPLVSVIPTAAASTAGLAVLFTAPVLSALAAQWSVGVGLAGGVIKLSAEQVRRLPLPAGLDDWARATEEFSQWLAGPRDDEHLRALAQRMNLAYGVAADTALEWWWQRRRQR